MKISDSFAAMMIESRYFCIYPCRKCSLAEAVRLLVKGGIGTKMRCFGFPTFHDGHLLLHKYGTGTIIVLEPRLTID